MFFTGVGGRKSPLHVLTLMTMVGYKFCIWGYDCCSGEAPGADTAFKEGYTKGREHGGTGRYIGFVAADATPEAMEIAGKFHPVWNVIRKDGRPAVSDYAKRLHGRNAFQILGRHLNEKSIGVVCWTPDGCVSHRERSILTGGTGTAISIADHYEVPVANLHNPAIFQQWRKWANDIRI